MNLRIKSMKSSKVDILSNLPDSIFHTILALLDIKDVGRFSTLSRKCRINCLSMPSLTIDLGNIPDPKGFYRFSSFLQRFMVLRNGNGLDSFQVEMHADKYEDDFDLHIGNWILQATNLNAREICLRLYEFSAFTLPSGVVNSAFLRDLEVSMSSNTKLNLPANSFGRLENLRLSHIRVSNMFGKFISSCKLLKTLYLDEVDAETDGLHISCSSLEDLVLDYIYVPFNTFVIDISAGKLKNLSMFWGGDPGAPVLSLTLYAPKLEKISLGGYVTHYSCQSNLDSLLYSDISAVFILPINKEDNEHMASGNGIIGKVLQSMRHVSSMIIHDHSIKEISSRELLPELCNLRSLTLKCLKPSEYPGYDVGSTQCIISLLNSMPHLNNMKIDGFGRYNDENICLDAEYLESQNLKFVHSLKEVDIEIEGKQNEMALIKYLLKNAKALKKITIRCHLCKSGPTQSDISQNIEQFQVASSFIAIYLLPH